MIVGIEEDNPLFMSMTIFRYMWKRVDKKEV